MLSGKRAGAAGLWKIRFSGPRSAKSKIKLQTLNMLRIWSGIQPSGVLHIGNYFGDDCGRGERRLHPADSIAAWMS